jgi:hypothetical protein
MTTGRRVFRVEVEITKMSEVYVEADSKKDAEKAVEADDLEAYCYYEDDVSVYAYEVVDLTKLSPGEVLHGVLDGEVCEITKPEYQARYGPEAEPAAPPDTVTLPLFKDEEKL